MIYTKIKKSLKSFFSSPKELISFFLPIVIVLLLMIPLPYYIKFGGGIVKLDNKISIDSKGKNGKFGALYVKEGKAVVATYLLSKVVPSFESEKEEDVTINDEDASNYNYRERYYFTSSIDAATLVAFEKAGKKVQVSSSKFLIIYIEKNANVELKIGDEILKVNGVNVTSYENMLKYINESNNNVKITVKRKNKMVETNNKFINIEGKKMLGIAITNEVKYKSNPKVKLNFNGKEAGPSGGLMIALTIYDKVMKEDISKGKLVVGTGAIDVNGNVGEIGGIKHKLMAASKKQADVVFVPYANYEEAKKEYDDNKYSFDLVSVKTFDDAVNYLKDK